MTANKALKRDVRARMGKTGENYTTAYRAITGDDGGDVTEPVTAALQPGRVVGVVSGGGLTNLQFILPHLVRLEDAGHRLTIVEHARKQPTPLDLPSLFDILSARKLLTTDQIISVLTTAGGDELLDAAINKLPPGGTTVGPASDQNWAQTMRTAAAAGAAPLLWVQDVQANAPFVRADAGLFDGVAAQMAALQGLAQTHHAIVAVGHCMPPDHIDGWDVIRATADETFVIGGGDTPGEERTVEHHTRNAPPYKFKQTLDTTISEWRQAYVRSRTRD